MLDLDHFKNINDTHGHEAGDEALQFFGALLQNCQRAGDVSARLGGEEFCVLLTQAGPEAALAFDRRLRAELAQRTPQTRSYHLDFSAGHAQFAPQDTLETLMARADTALYRAKHAGRGHLASADLPD
jgi:diguanylate cyclase (GGDEF)-like protein